MTQVVSLPGCSSACNKLSSTLRSEVSYPGDLVYQAELNGTNSYGYYSQQEIEVLSTCRVTPNTTQDVARALTILISEECEFAVRSGGHGIFVGFANIEGGVTIDLSVLNQVTISANNTITSVGPGARWRDVYTKLDPLGLAVTGARVDTLGVGGFTLGGGISWLAPRYGFGCDGVQNFEIVLASGAIVNANQNQSSDLYKALKGGSNNFGIVTRLDFFTHPNSINYWGGMVIYPGNTTQQQLQALQYFTTASGTGIDPYSTVENIYIYTGGENIIVNIYINSNGAAFPSILDNFTSIPYNMSDTLSTTSLLNLTIQAAPPNDARTYWGTATWRNNASFTAQVINLANATFQPYSNLTGFSTTLAMEPITREMTARSSLYGGDSLGLQNNTEDLILVQLGVTWADLGDDAVLEAAAQTFLKQLEAQAKAAGVHYPFKYANYAAPSQKVFQSYGKANYANLQKVAKKYDPYAVFQRLVPGGFKLSE
ncbi:MAG: hypothetical protein M1827_007261 [Pycnora praestabilis]|nr:MAG: hypothetical protein M1827_007261 [Pycnora praestabilis]